MEVRVRERLIGALVLVALVVLLVPAVLKGREPRPQQPAAQPTRSVEVLLDDEESPDKDEVLVPETLATEQPEPREPVTEPPRPVAETPAGPDVARQAPAKPETRRAASGPVAEATAATTAWAVQLGAFATRDKAESLVADLRKRGYAAFVLEYRASGKVLHRVRVGPEQDRERAAAIAERLRKDGFEPVVARHP
ncbi:MAG: SPOR domain-containing protein [Steroidobacteraceae bacterium]